MLDSTKSQQPKLLAAVRNVLRLHHYSIHTERSYVDWIVRFVRFHDLWSRTDLVLDARAFDTLTLSRLRRYPRKLDYGVTLHFQPKPTSRKEDDSGGTNLRFSRIAPIYTDTLRFSVSLSRV